MTLVLVAAAVLLGASVFAKVTGFLLQPGRMQGDLTLLHAQDPNRLKQCLGKARETADAIKKNNLFVKVPPKQNPVKQVEGILGSEAFIGGKWYKVGDKIGDAKVVAIHATEVRIEWNGKETSFSPIGSGKGGPSARQPPAVARKKEAGPMPKPVEVKVVRAETPAPAEEDPLGWLGVELSPKLRALLLEKWNNASPEERERGKEEWNKMSDEQRQQAVQSMEQHM